VRDSNRKPAAGESQRGLEVYSPTQALAVGRKRVTPKKKNLAKMDEIFNMFKVDVIK
jgi:hypothetical protein